MNCVQEVPNVHCTHDQMPHWRTRCRHNEGHAGSWGQSSYRIPFRGMWLGIIGWRSTIFHGVRPLLSLVCRYMIDFCWFVLHMSIRGVRVSDNRAIAVHKRGMELCRIQPKFGLISYIYIYVYIYIGERGERGRKRERDEMRWDEMRWDEMGGEERRGEESSRILFLFLGCIITHLVVWWKLFVISRLIAFYWHERGFCQVCVWQNATSMR